MKKNIYMFLAVIGLFPLIGSAAGIKVTSASYGQNCGVSAGNVTHYVKSSCNGGAACDYLIDHKVIGDPARGCRKDFIVKWSCGQGSGTKSKYVSAEASGKRAHLNCGNKVKIKSATYGKNCGVSDGNVSHYVKSSCNGRAVCNYFVNHKLIGDPAHGCKKDFIVNWSCSNGGAWRSFLPPEASGKSVYLSCK